MIKILMFAVTCGKSMRYQDKKEGYAKEHEKLFLRIQMKIPQKLIPSRHLVQLTW
jgi:hypothetical protein